MNDKLMLTKGKKEKILLVDYRDWLLIVEPNFPSNNYVVTKKNASHGFRPAYCSSLVSAVKTLFDQILLLNIIEKDEYGGSFGDLRDVIVETKKEFEEFVIPSVKELKCEGV